MKKIIVTLLIITAFLLVACGEDTKQNEENNVVEDNQSTNDAESKQSESDNDSSDEASSKENNESNSNVENPLSDYSSEEIEYARIWLQLGANQDVDTLYAEHISAGEPLNSDDESTVDYPEDVVQLSGTRLVDGVVTYSSNGDGTINVYNVPKRWDGMNPAGEVFYEDIIENTELISVDPGADENVEALIKMLEIN